jgi:hypothetical protein
MMATIKVPKPPKSAFNKKRPVSSLLRAHLEHLQRAEFRLPSEMQTNIYINAIKTEGEAADYIGQVTARLHAAHAGEKSPKAKGKKVISIAAMAAGPKKKRKSVKVKTKKKTKAGGRRR